MRETIKEYFSFSKKERTGIFILMTIIVFVAVLPEFYTATDSLYGDSTALYRFRDQVVQLADAREKTAAYLDSASGPYSSRNLQANPGGAHYQNDDKDNYIASRQAAMPITMFPFDPNLIPIEDWTRLGISKKTALTIDKYRSKGGKFRKPGDLLKIYGLSESDKQRLLPFVRIATETRDQSQFKGKPWPGNVATELSAPVEKISAFKRKAYINTAINSADTVAWTQLPGIGAVLSQRIIKYRDKLGGFYKIDQVAEVYGLPDSVFQKIRPYLQCDAAIRRINVNDATPEILEQHPYLRRQLARAIVDYRSQHGSFRQLQDLKQIVAISADLFERIAPYLEL